MSLITVTRIIEDITPAEAYSTAKQPERFAEVMPDLKSVEIINQCKEFIDTKWIASINVGPLSRKIEWIERDWWNDSEYRCDFKLLEGDMKTYQGSWSFSSINNTSCEIRIELDFELGIPMIGPLINKIVDSKVKENCDALLSAVAQLCGK